MLLKSKKAIAAVKAFNELNAEIKRLEAEKDKQREIIIRAMNSAEEAEVMVDDTKMFLRYRDVRSPRVDVKLVRSKYPAVADECTVVSSSQRFTISLK